jgi:hypothetical protein
MDDNQSSPTSQNPKHSIAPKKFIRGPLTAATKMFKRSKRDLISEEDDVSKDIEERINPEEPSNRKGQEKSRGLNFSRSFLGILSRKDVTEKHHNDSNISISSEPAKSSPNGSVIGNSKNFPQASGKMTLSQRTRSFKN